MRLSALAKTAQAILLYTISLCLSLSIHFVSKYRERVI
jgi:hypothetical protein